MRYHFPMEKTLAKDLLRAELLARRERTDTEAAARSDALIAEQVLGSPFFRSAEMVASYFSLEGEVDTRRLLQEALREGKSVALPRVMGPGEMDWHKVTSLEGLVRSRLGIMEPVDDPDTKVGSWSGLRALALVPALAFDAEGWRLGYGGGFYDRFLPAFKECGGVALGLCRSANLREEGLPREAHDACVDAVATEEGIHVCGGSCGVATPS